MELNAMKEREAICDVCHKMWQRGIVAANDGNVSVKLEDGTFLCTPSGVSKAAMTPEILVHLAADGSVISAAEGYKPSSEMKMHFRCYAEREDVKAVVHAHPPIATSYASMGRALDGYQAMEFISVQFRLLRMHSHPQMKCRIPSHRFFKIMMPFYWHITEH